MLLAIVPNFDSCFGLPLLVSIALAIWGYTAKSGKLLLFGTLLFLAGSAFAIPISIAVWTSDSVEIGTDAGGTIGLLWIACAIALGIVYVSWFNDAEPPDIDAG